MSQYVAETLEPFSPSSNLSPLLNANRALRAGEDKERQRYRTRLDAHAQARRRAGEIARSAWVDPQTTTATEERAKAAHEKKMRDGPTYGSGEEFEMRRGPWISLMFGFWFVGLMLLDTNPDSTMFQVGAVIVIALGFPGCVLMSMRRKRR